MNLKIASKESHEGTWTCLADNPFGESDTKSVDIFVASKTSMKNGGGNNVVQAHVGEMLTLNCDVEVNENFRDSLKIVWTKNGDAFDNAGQNIFVKNVTDEGSDTAGLYECR